MLAYAEDPCGAESGFSGREIMAEFRRATGIPTAHQHGCNRLARIFAHAAELHAIDILLADPHFWTMEGPYARPSSAAIGDDLGPTFEQSLRHLGHVHHVAAAATGQITPVDTHWIWQDGQRLTREPLQIVDGAISIPGRPGLGIEPDMEQIEGAHLTYKRLRLGARDDTVVNRIPRERLNVTYVLISSRSFIAALPGRMPQPPEELQSLPSRRPAL